MARTRVIFSMSLIVASLGTLPIAAQEYSRTVSQLIAEDKLEAAIQLLKTPIAALDSAMTSRELTDEELSTYRDACLNLAKVYVAYYHKDELDRPVTALDWKEDAKQAIDKLLSVYPLRRTLPDSSASTPPLVHELFAEVKTTKFGRFQVQELSPPDSWVILENDTLQIAPGDSFPSETDIPAGSYSLVIAHEDYRALRQTILIPAGATFTAPYALQPARNWWWWTWRGGVVAGTATAVALLIPGKEEAAPPAVLPEPPGPPSR